MEDTIEKLPIYFQPYTYKKADGQEGSLNVPLFELPAGTLLFRGVQLPNPKKDEDPRLFVRDWLGYPRGERFCMTPTHNTFFYTSPYVPFGAHTVGEWFNAIMVYQTVKNLRIVAMISPSAMTRGGKELKALDGTAPIQRCNKFDYSCFESQTSAEARKEKEMKSFDNCIHPDFAAENTVSGWMAIADYDSLDNFKEGLKGKDTTMGKYIIDLNKRLPGKGIELLTSTYTDATNHRGFPEIVLFPWSPHPGKENQYTEARTEEDAADAIAEMSDRFNYLPIACITERGIVEAFTGDFKAGDLPRFATSAMPGALTRKKIDDLQTTYLEKLMTSGVDVEGLGTAHAMFDTRTGFYVMDLFSKYYIPKNQRVINPYTDLLLSLASYEDREKVLEYKVKYRTFFMAALSQEDTLLDGTVVKREFVFKRPDQLYEQFKELGIRFPAKLIPYIYEATERYQLNRANQKSKNDPRGAEEARRQAAEAREKIKSSLATIAAKKAEMESKRPKGKTLPALQEEPKKSPVTPPWSLEQEKKPIVYKYLNGIQSSIPVIRTMAEAVDIGLDALQQPNLKAHSFYPIVGLDTTQLNAPWRIHEESLRLTMKYIFEKIHANCYLLCVRDKVPYLFKLEGRGLSPLVRKVLEEQIAEKQITDINLDNTRVMQCVVKSYSEEATTANEWLTFLQNPLNKEFLLPNGIFILNLSDSTLLRNDGLEPFEHFLKPTPMEEEYREKYYLPIFSYSAKRGYFDFPLPTFDDIQDLVRSPGGNVILEDTFGKNVKYDMWQKEIDKVVFRGSSTGCGTTSESNMRLKISDPNFVNTLRNKDMIDAGITKVTKQYKMDPKLGLSKVDPNTPTVPTLTYAEQANYKYILHIDGNVFAYRLLKTMLLGSCILRVGSRYSGWMDIPGEETLYGYDIHSFGDDQNTSKEADPYYCQFIWVENDLSDLDDVLDFCKSNPSIVNIIASNAKKKALEVLSMKFLFASFVNLLSISVINSINNEEVEEVENQQGGRQKKGTRKTKVRKQQTRKYQRSEGRLVLAKYKGGGLDDSMQEYIHNAMSKVWKNYIRNMTR